MGYFTYLEMGDELGLTNPLILTFYQHFLSGTSKIIQAQPMETEKNPASSQWTGTREWGEWSP